MALGNGLNLAIGEASVVLVGAASLLLVVAVATRPDSSFIESLTRWSPVIIAGSFLVGAAGLDGYAVLNIPVQQMGVNEGIGPINIDTYTVLLTLRKPGTHRRFPDGRRIRSYGVACDWPAPGRGRDVARLPGLWSEFALAHHADRRLTLNPGAGQVRPFRKRI